MGVEELGKRNPLAVENGDGMVVSHEEVPEGRLVMGLMEQVKIEETGLVSLRVSGVIFDCNLDPGRAVGKRDAQALTECEGKWVVMAVGEEGVGEESAGLVQGVSRVEEEEGKLVIRPVFRAAPKHRELEGVDLAAMIASLQGQIEVN